MKILSQTGKELYEFEGNNIFVVDDMMFISKEVNAYVGRPGILGQYNNTEECLEVLESIINNYVTDRLIVENLLYRMPEKKEKVETEKKGAENENK